MDGLNKNREFYINMDNNYYNRQNDWSHNDPSEEQLHEDFLSYEKEFIRNDDNCFDNKISFDNEPNHNLHHPNLKEEILPEFSSPLKDLTIKSPNDLVKSESSNLAEIEHPISNPDVRSTKRVKIKENDEEMKGNDESKVPQDISQEKKKELNRKSASQCRKRRKQYVEQLEKRVDDLENEVHSLKRKLRFYEQNEKLNALSQKESILQYLTGKYDEYDKLDNLLKKYDNDQQEDQEICKCLNTIKIRNGGQGFVRKQTVNYLLKKVIEKIVPGHVKYIVAS